MLPEAPSQPNADDIRFESYLPVLTIPLDHPFLAGPSQWPPASHTLAASLGVCKFLSGDWQNTRSRTGPLTLWVGAWVENIPSVADWNFPRGRGLLAGGRQ